MTETTQVPSGWVVRVTSASVLLFIRKSYAYGSMYTHAQGLDRPSDLKVWKTEGGARRWVDARDKAEYEVLSLADALNLITGLNKAGKRK
jgi:hypothetical protein